MIYDLGNRWLTAAPVKTKGANHAYNALLFHAGRQRLRYMHTDDAKELIKCCKMHGIPHKVSAPGMSQENGLAESMVHIEVEGADCDLSHSGHPSCFWPLATEATGDVGWWPWVSPSEPRNPARKKCLLRL